MAGRPKLTTLEQIRRAMENVVQLLDGLPISAKSRQRLTAQFDGIEIDIKKAIYTYGAPEKVLIISRETGEMTTVDGYKAELAKWASEDRESYNVYVHRMQDFLNAFRDDSLFVRMLGRHGEKVLPPILEADDEV